MKRGTSVVRWRPLAGVVFAGALAMGVAAFAAPRTGPETSDRGTKVQTRVQSEAAELVSGASEHLLSVVAGSGAGAKVELFPVAARIGAYPGSANVAITEPTIIRPVKGPTPCNEIAMDHGGFDIWMEWKVSGWDANGDDLLPGTGVCTATNCTSGWTGAPPGSCTVNSDCDLMTAAVYQGAIVGAGMLDADIDLDGEVLLDGAQTSLFPALVSCPSANAAGNAFCVANMGGGGSKCLSTVVNCPFAFCCANMWYDKGATRADDICAGISCQGDCDISSPFLNYRCFAAAESPDIFHDDSTKKFGGYFMVTVPGSAKGRYFIDANSAASFMQDRHSPPADIPLSEESGACVFIRVGQCCKNLGLPSESCEDNLTKAECETVANEPYLWTQGKTCAEGCVQCLLVGQIDPLCNDNDACTDDTCNALQLCPHALITGFNPVTDCCNPVDGDIDTRDDGDVCTGDVCTQSNSRGDASNLPITGPCLDGNPCTTNDQCNGTQSQADGGCSGSDVNAVPCVGGVCPVVNEIDGSSFDCSLAGNCFCTLTPDLDYIIVGDEIKNRACQGGAMSGFFCESDLDCPGGFCNEFAHGSNCFDSGTKFVAKVHIGSAGAPINGGQFLLTYDPNCVTLNSIAGLPPYVDTLYGPVYGTGSVFIAVGVDYLLNANGPLGGVDILQLSFTKTGVCDTCELCFDSNNPSNTYLVDDVGQRVEVSDNCKAIRELPELTLDIPGNANVNRDCDVPTATVTWDAPSASSDCGPAAMTCRGAHESGLQYSANGTVTVGGYLNGGILPPGASSFCCFASEDQCGQTAGCAGRVNDCAGTVKPDGCWTVNVSDETSLDIDVQLEPTISHTDPDGVLTRCIKFCLFGTLAEAPYCFSQDVTFGGLFNFVGKAGGKIKVPGTTQWGCITAQDQQHTLRSCYYFNHATDCLGGQLHAEFAGDPGLDGNWLVGGNLDGWKKDDGDPTTNPSLDVIDILDFGTFVGQYGNCYADNDTPCPSSSANADINGDGCVTTSDYNFIIRNFLTSTKDCCGGPQIGSEPVVITEITVEELVQMGQGDLAVADLNGDGVLNTADMEAFLEGARPTKGSNNRGGKGVRSGR